MFLNDARVTKFLPITTKLQRSIRYKTSLNAPRSQSSSSYKVPGLKSQDRSPAPPPMTCAFSVP